MSSEPSGTSPPEPPLLLELEIDQQAPLRGHLSSRTGVTREFSGWAGLASTLMTFLAKPDDPNECAD